MMPVVRGARSTRLQIFVYSLLLVAVAALPGFTGLGRAGYDMVSFGGGALFLLLALRLWRSRAGEASEPGPDGLYAIKPGAKEARDLFAYSILYLFALFTALLLEHAIRGMA